MIFHGDITLVPSLSDSFYVLLNDIVKASERAQESIAYPAGAIIIAIACIESYLNELVHMHTFNENGVANEEVKKKNYEVWDGYT